ncbi:MAG: hypothetical protein ABJB69_07610 [Spartobacteria bacterium]
MKKYILLAICFVGLAFTGGQLFAHDDEGHGDWNNHSQLNREVRHANSMMAHVRWELREYHGNRHIRQEVRHLADELGHVNSEVNSGHYDGGHVHSEIEHIHNELHHVETELNVPSIRFYRWN